jgi:hypothetical protein
MDETSLNKNRLSDRILYALKLSVDQQDAILSDILVNALELSMTRNAGGKEFTERRTYSPEIEAELTKLSSIKK